MSQISYFSYQLEAKNSLNSRAQKNKRSGVLLRFIYPNGQVSYADLFPWQEFGDVSWKNQLRSLRQGQKTALMQRTLDLAEENLNFLRPLNTKKSASSGLAKSQLKKIENHFLLTSANLATKARLKKIGQQGFKIVKIKVGRDWRSSIQKVDQALRDSKLKIRFDFNACLEEQEFIEFTKSLSAEVLRRVDFFEDPIPWNPTSWRRLSEHFPLAIDFEFEKLKPTQLQNAPPFDVFIYKPARQNLSLVKKILNHSQVKIVVTSSMDHPLGVASALYQALAIKKIYGRRLLTCGLMTFHCYKKNDFNRFFEIKGSSILALKNQALVRQLEEKNWKHLL